MKINKILLGMTGLLALSGAAFAADSVPAAPVAQPKFEVYDPTNYKGETGKVAMPGAGSSMFLLRRFDDGKLGDYLQVSGSEKEVAVPVGTYKMEYCSATAEGKAGTSWNMIAQGDLEKDGPIKIESGKTIHVPAIDKAAASMREAKTGVVSLPYAGESSIYLMPQGGRGGYLMGTGKSKDMAVPEGKYIVAQYASTVADKSGVKWRMLITPPSEKGALTIEVKQGESVKLSSCEPVTASIDAKQDGDKLSLSLQMGGKGKCVIQRADGKGDAPGFQILSKSGEVLSSGKFAYG